MPILTQRICMTNHINATLTFALVGTSYDKSVPSMVHYYGRDRKEKGSGPYFHAMRPTSLRDTSMTIDGVTYLLYGQRYTKPTTYYKIDGENLFQVSWTKIGGVFGKYGVKIRVNSVANNGSDGSNYNFSITLRDQSYFGYKTQPDLSEALTYHFSEVMSSKPLSTTVVSAPLGANSDWGEIAYNSELDYSSFEYKRNELSVWLTAKQFSDAALLPSTVSSGLGMAYMDAVSRLPNTTINGLESITEACSGIASILRLITGDARGLKNLLASKPKDTWLLYRYVYNTTRTDIESLVEYTRRLSNLPSDYTFIKSRGTYEGENSSYRITVCFKRDEVIPQNLIALVESLGLRLSAQNIWDIIPYSFVVDWFAKIGPILEQLDAYSKAVSLKPTEVWASYKTFYDDQITYSRFQITGLKPVIPPLREVGKKTLMYRFVDALSLFFVE